MTLEDLESMQLDEGPSPGKVSLTAGVYPRRPAPAAAIQRKAISPGTVQAAHADNMLKRARESTGAPMSAPIKNRMEASFGASLDGVRVHTGGAAADASRGLNARAFTTGEDIYFGQGAYDPNSQSGQHLLAHEVAHVVQGGSGAKSSGTGLSISDPADAAERAADRAADAVVRGQPVGALGSAPASAIARDGLEDLDEALDGGIFGIPSRSDVWSSIAALSDADKTQLATGGGQAENRRQLFELMDSVALMSRLFNEVPQFPIDVRFAGLDTAGVTGSMTAQNWLRFVDRLSDDDKRALATNGGHLAHLRTIASTLTTAGRITGLFARLPDLTLAGKLECLSASGTDASFTAAQWTTFLGGLSDADKQTLVTDHRSVIVHIIRAQAGPPQHVGVFATLPHIDLADKIDMLDQAGALVGLGTTEWETLVGFSSPDEIQALRSDARLNGLYLANAPDSIVPAWDRLNGLIGGAWTPAAPGDIPAAAALLSPAQKLQMRENHALMASAAVALRGSPADIFQLCSELDVEIKFCVHWFNTANAVAAITDAQWGQLIGEATPAEMTALSGWEEIKDLFEANCPEALRDAGDEIPADPVALLAWLNSTTIAQTYTQLGAAGLLGVVTRPGIDVHAAYRKVDRANHIMLITRNLPRGSAMGQQATEGLRAWFFDCRERRRNVLELIFETRFDVVVTPTNAMSTLHNDASTRLARWTVDGLKQSWEVLETLPPDGVENNPNWDRYLRNQRGGSSYYWGRDDSVVMSYRRNRELGEDDHSDVYGAGGQYGAQTDAMGNEIAPESPDVAMTFFNATVRHEIGHGVDAQLGMMSRWRATQPCGTWQSHGSVAAFVTAIINEWGGIGPAAANPHGYPAQDVPEYRNAMIFAITNAVPFQDAIDSIQAGKTPPVAAGAAPDAGPISAVFDIDRWHEDEDPWDYNMWSVGPNGRAFHAAYGGEYWSFDHNRRTSNRVTDYQWRAPGEWFAEVYSVYYAEQESSPDAAVGGILRSRDEEAANLITNFVDRGHSPQDVRGAGGRPDHEVAAPGTGGP